MPLANRKKAKTRSRFFRITSSVLLLVLILSCFGIKPVSASENTAPSQYRPSLEVNISAHSAIAIETGRLRRLYTKNPDQIMAIPAASKIMTALLACERLKLNTPITISAVASEAAITETTRDGLSLKSGDKYPLEYLLLRLMFYDSDAAAIAIAEQISNVEEQFVELMNWQAEQLELNNTIFYNSTGNPVYDDYIVDPGDRSNELDTPFEPLSIQTTTVSDLARLLAYALNNPVFSTLIGKENEYLILPDDTLASMRSNIQPLWTLSEDRITGAFYCEWDNRAYTVAIGRTNGFYTIIILANGNPGQRISDVLTLIEQIENTYIQTPLVSAGEPFSGYQEQTVDGETFGLVFKRTIPYVHPVDDIFLTDSVQYISRGPHERPIEYSMVAGQVIFQLKDGTQIAVDVGPQRQILSKITILNQVLNLLQGNQNIFFAIATSAVLLLLIMLFHLVNRVSRLARLVRLVLLERRSRR